VRPTTSAPASTRAASPTATGAGPIATGASSSTATREAILERAVDLASTDGLEGLTIGRLAGELGMSKSGLFAHFGSKEELQLATVAEAARRFMSEVIEPAQAAAEGAARLRDYCDRYVDYLERRVFPGGCFWAAAGAEFDDRPGPVRDAVRGAVAAWLGELENQARRAGAENPDQLAFELWATVQGANSACRLLGDPSAFDRARRAIERLLPA
jgi:AcrR family transcriptional regulator